MAEFNYMAGLSTAGTILSTGANIYTSIQQGEIKAIQYEAEAKRKKFQSEMAALDKQSKMEQLNIQFEEQAVGMVEEFAAAGESQLMSAMLQGRDISSLESVATADEEKYIRDQMKAKLGKEYTEGQIESDYRLQKTMTDLDIKALGSAADIARKGGKIGALGAATSGLQTLARTNAFDPEAYWEDEKVDDDAIKKATSKKQPSSYVKASDVYNRTPGSY
jgi:hypothetical protein